MKTKIGAKVFAKLNAKVRTRQTERTTTNRANKTRYKQYKSSFIKCKALINTQTSVWLQTEDTA